LVHGSRITSSRSENARRPPHLTNRRSQGPSSERPLADATLHWLSEPFPHFKWSPQVSLLAESKCAWYRRYTPLQQTPQKNQISLQSLPAQAVVPYEWKGLTYRSSLSYVRGNAYSGWLASIPQSIIFMEVSQPSNETLTQPVRQTLYNSSSNHSQLQHLDNLQFVARKRRSLPGVGQKRMAVTDRPTELEAEAYLNSEFVPRLPAKHLAAAPKFLFSLERKRLRIRNGISSKNNMGSDMQRTFFKGDKPRKSTKCVDRCKHTHEVHNAKTPQWCIVPPVIVRERA